MTQISTDSAAYQAAHHALSGRFNGDIAATAALIAAELAETQRHYGLTFMRLLTLDAGHRASTVEHITTRVGEVRGGVNHARQMVDTAVLAAARALWAS
ncbi:MULTISPECIES: hypothetical protein [unclassified Micromonospora]|uniref:hypothetical protein n=1 Tax=unclassified Micromonospora TaxID=2617518 RepID=UPI003332CDEB